MVPHEPWLVVLSIAIAIQGSFVGLSLARGLDGAEGGHRRFLLAGSSLTLATGVWSMHFVGMLAAEFPSAIDYLVLPTLVSFLICVIVVGIGVYAAHADGSRALRIGGGAVGMGLGISFMHYVGMSAVHLAGPTYQEPPFVVSSVAISIVASAIRVVVAGQTRDAPAHARGGDRPGTGDLRDALYRDGGHAAGPAVFRRLAFRRRRFRLVAQYAGVADDDDRLWRFRRLLAFARARRAPCEGAVDQPRRFVRDGACLARKPGRRFRL